MSILFFGNFPELNRKFIETVTANRADDPLAPLTVIIPGQLLRVALRRDLVREGVSHANVHFSTLNELARKITEPLLYQRRLRVLGDVAGDLFLQRAIDSVFSQLDYFKNTAPRRGFRKIIQVCIADLRGAGLSVEAIAEIAQERRLPETTRTKLRELAAIWKSLNNLYSAHGLIDRLGILDLAMERLKTDGRLDHPLIIYGLDELTALERRILSFLWPKETMVFLPYRNSPAYEWTKPLYEWFKEKQFELHELVPKITNYTMLNRLRQGLFESEPVPHDAEIKSDQSLFFTSAPDNHAESEEAARGVLRPVVETTQTSAILMRSSETHVDGLRDIFDSIRVQPYFHECKRLGDSASGAAMRNIVRLLDNRWRRADVTDFLLTSSLKVPSCLSGLPVIPAPEWHHFSLLAGIVEGKEQWITHLKRLAGDWTWRADQPSSDDEITRNYAARAQSVKCFIAYLEFLFAEAGKVLESATWKDMLDRVWDLFNKLVNPDSETESICEQLSEAYVLDAAGIQPSAAALVRIVEAALNAPASRDGKFQANEPTIATVQQAAGLLFDQVILVGLSEKQFPRMSPQDAVLLDGERAQLSDLFRQAGRMISVPLRSRLFDREKFYFAVAISGAKKRLILSFPRRDEKRHRDVLPSRFLLDVSETLTGTSADYDVLDMLIQTQGIGTRISSDPLQSAGTAVPLTELDYDNAQLAKALQEKSTRPIAYLQKDSGFLRAIDAEESRYAHRKFTRYDGQIESDAVRAVLQQWLTEKMPAFSASHLEAFWKCPYSFLGKHILGLEAVEDPEDIATIDAQTRGQLVHRILEEFYRAEARAGRKLMDESALQRLHGIARNIFAGFEQHHATGLFMLWEREKQHILDRVRRVLHHEIENASGYTILHLEYKIGFNQEPVKLDLSEEKFIHLFGKIDRIDEDMAAGLRIIDYKSGKMQKRRKDLRLLDIGDLQLYTYILLAEAAQQKTVDEAAYYFLGGDELQIEQLKSAVWQLHRDDVKRVLKIIAERIRGGSFYPYPDEDYCRFCEIKTACGQGRWTYKWDTQTSPDSGFSAMRSGNDE